MGVATTPRLRVSLVQQGVWAMDLESMPLAMGYLEAVLDTDPTLRGEVETRIFNFDGSHSLTDISGLSHRLPGGAAVRGCA